jgi:hypothetical protein
MIKIYLFAFFILFISSVEAENEAYYQDICAKILNGKTEVVMSDKTRVDILTEGVAFEVDWAYKAYEGIGQCLYYSAKTGLHAGLILIVKDPVKDQKYIDRVRLLIRIKSIKINLYVIDIKSKELRLIEK